MADYARILINLCSVEMTSLIAFVNVYGDRNDYALSEVTANGVDTEALCLFRPSQTLSICEFPKK